MSAKNNGIAEALAFLGRESEGRGMTYGHILETLGDRGFGAAILIFSLPNTLLISSIPGLSTILSIPIVLLSAQWLFRAKHPWLPKRLAEKKLPEKAFARVLGYGEHASAWLEKHGLLRPRLALLVTRPAQMFGAVLTMLLAFIMFLPIPLGNFFPGLAITLLSLGMIEKDGAMTMAGILFGIMVAAAFYGSIVFGLDIGIAALS